MAASFARRTEGSFSQYLAKTSEADLHEQQEWVWNNSLNSIQFQERLPEPMLYKSSSMSCYMQLG